MITIKHGATDQSVYFVLVDSDGNEATGQTITDLDITYVRDRAAAVKADATALASATAAHGDNQAIEVDATNAPGLYRVDYPDAAFVSGVDRVQLIVNGAAIKPAIIEVSLVAKLVSDLKDAAAAPSAATVASQVRTELGTELGRIDVAISSRNATTPPTVAAIRTELEGSGTKLSTIHAKLPDTHIAESVTLDGLYTIVDNRLTAARAGYLDKLNVSGTLAHSNAANTYKADVSGLATSAEIAALHNFNPASDKVIVETNEDKTGYELTSGERTNIATSVWASTTRTLSSFGSLVADMAAAVWAYAGRALTVNPPTAKQIRSELDNNSTKLGLIDAATAQLASTLESDGDGGYQFTEKALENAPTSGPEWTPEEKAAALAALEELIVMGKCDIVTNTETVPWREEYRNASTSELLYYKHLYKLDGSPVTSINDYAAYKLEIALP